MTMAAILSELSSEMQLKLTPGESRITFKGGEPA